MTAADQGLGTVIHAYGVVPGGAAVAIPETGIAGAGVALLDAGPVAAVFSRLGETEYGDAVWHAHAEDPQWLAEVATEHQQVLGQIVEDSDVVPLRLPAMYRDEAHLHAALETHAALFTAVLRTIHDHVEWGVQLFHSGEATASPSASATGRPTSGRDYLRQRSDAAADRELGRVRRRKAVAEAYAALADVARHSVVNQPHDRALSGRSEAMLLNSAHLVGRRHRDAFVAAVHDVAARLAPAGITVEVSGPWPAYNFVDLGPDPLEAAT